MPIEDLSYSSLEHIRRKVRKLTSSPSTNQLTDADIDYYVNTFVLYSYPEDIKLFNLKKTIKFFTQPNIDTYSTNLLTDTDPLYNFKNRYSFTGEPAYVGGVRAIFTQDRSQFYRAYPFVNYSYTIGYGDGIIDSYSGVLPSIPILRNNVLFTSIDASNNGLTVIDDGAGNLTESTGIVGAINYITGVYSFAYSNPPAVQEEIKAKTVPYNPSIPTVICFFDNSFILRPVPDEVYAVSLEVYKRPDQLLDTGDMPELSQHWEYIAYGATKKIFEDRRDLDSKQEIMPAFEEQEQLIRSKSTMQLSEQRVSTIYEDKSFFGNPNFPFTGRF
jgi:hypothetical protein